MMLVMTLTFIIIFVKLSILKSYDYLTDYHNYISDENIVLRNTLYFCVLDFLLFNKYIYYTLCKFPTLSLHFIGQAAFDHFH